MKFIGVFLLLVACAATARAFDMDMFLKECSVERTGPGSRTALQSEPSLQTVCKRRNFYKISAGAWHTCALGANGAYECIGSDKHGRSNGHKPKWPKSNPGGENKDGAKYVQVSAGNEHTCALTSEGAYECIGNDKDGQTNGKKRKWPGKKKDGAKYVQVSAGAFHTCALTSEGAYECIGNDKDGQSNGEKPKWPRQEIRCQVHPGQCG